MARASVQSKKKRNGAKELCRFKRLGSVRFKNDVHSKIQFYGTNLVCRVKFEYQDIIRPIFSISLDDKKLFHI